MRHPIISRSQIIFLLCAFSLLPVALAHQLGGAFSLTDERGDAFHLQQMQGRIVLLFFGYTSCPDICPRELDIMAQVLRRFNHQKHAVQGVFVTVDPQRDSVEKLHQYVSYFNDNLIGLTGAPPQIKAVADQYGVYYKVTRDAAGKVSVEHSSQLFIIDRHGKLQAIVPFGLGVEHISNLISGMLQAE
jgi:protein SCO1/2